MFSSTLSIHDYMRGNCLDIHGLSQGTAFIALSIFINNHWKKDPFILITGKGQHSKNCDSYAMRNFLQEKIKVQFPHLNCVVDESHPGRLNVS